MKHLGNICDIKGDAVDPCWVVIGGSPCQDLSVAGKRAGLAGERSGLFMEQIRIIKEMREADVCNGRTNEHIRPRWMVWENVPGALSSGEPKGEDFRIVLEECARVKDPNAVIPRPPKGKWQNCGCIVGDGWSIAWTIRNAQFYGIPQRRRRIALVADFGGQSAAEILFESKSVSGNNRESNQERKTREDSRGFAEGFGVAERGGKLSEVGAISFQERAGKPGGGRTEPQYSLSAYGIDTYNQEITEERMETIRTCAGGDNMPKVGQPITAAFCPEEGSKTHSIGWAEELSPTLRGGGNPSHAKAGRKQ